MSLCHTGLRLERVLDELVWESPTLGLGATSFLIGAYRGLGDQEHWALARGPSNHLERHALLRAAITGLDTLEPAFWGRPFAAIDQGSGSAPRLGRKPLLGPLPSGS